MRKSLDFIDPIEKSTINLNWDSMSITGQSDKISAEFINENIIKILPLVTTTTKKETDLHKEQKSNFNYREHYELDAEHFDYFKEKDFVSEEENNRLHQYILNLIPINTSIILDVGCGNGWAAQHLVSEDTLVISMDISTRNPIKAIEKNNHENHIGLIADAYYVPISDNSIDCIIASEIMEHVPNPKQFINSLYKKIKVGGKLVISTPYNENIPFHTCVHCNKLTPSHAHLHKFNESNIVEHLPENINSYHLHKFTNIYLLKLRLYSLLNFLPFSIWKTIDSLANKIIHKENRFIIEIFK